MNHERLTVETHDASAWSAIAEPWRILVEHCGHSTFFVTQEWVATWLETFGPRLAPRFLLFRTSDDRIVGASLLVQNERRRGPFVLRALHLHTAGEKPGESPFLEFNTLLCEPGYEHAMAQALRRHVDELRRDQGWDEFLSAGVVEGAGCEALREAFGDLLALTDTRPSYYVPLDALRDEGKSYLDSLSSRERTRYRQNAKRYGKHGDLVCERAATVDEALQFLDELTTLHQRTWIARGKPGAFASPVFGQFHRCLIERCAPLGMIDLVRVRAGHTTIGCLYNFVFRRKAYFYQCGFDYDLDERGSPGVVVHALAIQDAIARGHAEYDLLAGDFDYKKKLARHHRELHWLKWRAPSLKMKTYDFARRTNQLWRAARG
jgi:CelD/BcsL family acetyltransferase involved in cellulose biosynthesis